MVRGLKKHIPRAQTTVYTVFWAHFMLLCGDMEVAVALNLSIDKIC